MTINRCAPFLYGPSPATLFSVWNQYVDLVILDSDTDYFFFHFTAPISETVDRFEFSIGSVTVAGLVKVQIFPVQADGSPNAASAVGSEATVNVTATGLFLVTGLAAALTAGTMYGIRITVAAGVDLTLVMAHSNAQSYGSAVGATNVSGSLVLYGVSYSGSPVALGPTDGLRSGYSPFWIGAGDLGNQIYDPGNSGGPNIFVGNKFTMPFKGRIGGFATLRGAIAPQDATVMVCNAAGSILTSRALSATRNLITVNPLSSHFFPGYDFAAGEVFYLGFRSDSATDFGLYTRQLRAAESIAGAWGPGINRATATALGTWTETANQYDLIYPLIIGLDDGAGGGGTTIRSRPGARFSS